ncbi:hypothetical protein C8Q77DRAFT_691264 [Trametes polyzona]|nr:hypothetical protein C8Q77DRAFT_691264 [Trametes polyzona]
MVDSSRPKTLPATGNRRSSRLPLRLSFKPRKTSPKLATGNPASEKRRIPNVHYATPTPPIGSSADFMPNIPMKPPCTPIKSTPLTASLVPLDFAQRRRDIRERKEGFEMLKDRTPFAVRTQNLLPLDVAFARDDIRRRGEHFEAPRPSGCRGSAPRHVVSLDEPAETNSMHADSESGRPRQTSILARVHPLPPTPPRSTPSEEAGTARRITMVPQRSRSQAEISGSIHASVNAIHLQDDDCDQPPPSPKVDTAPPATPRSPVLSVSTSDPCVQGTDSSRSVYSCSRSWVDLSLLEASIDPQESWSYDSLVAVYSSENSILAEAVGGGGNRSSPGRDILRALSTSTFDEESFIRMAEEHLGW